MKCSGAVSTVTPLLNNFIPSQHSPDPVFPPGRGVDEAGGWDDELLEVSLWDQTRL